MPNFIIALSCSGDKLTPFCDFFLLKLVVNLIYKRKKNCNVYIYKKHQVVAVMNYHPSVMLFF